MNIYQTLRHNQTKMEPNSNESIHEIKSASPENNSLLIPLREPPISFSRATFEGNGCGGVTEIQTDAAFSFVENILMQLE